MLTWASGRWKIPECRSKTVRTRPNWHPADGFASQRDPDPALGWLDFTDDRRTHGSNLGAASGRCQFVGTVLGGGGVFFKAVMVQSPVEGVIDTGGLAESPNFDCWRSSRSAFRGPGHVHSNGALITTGRTR